MRVNVRTLVPVGPSVPPVAPAAPVAPVAEPARLVDTIRDARGAVGDGVALLRELREAKSLLAELGFQIGPARAPVGFVTGNGALDVVEAEVGRRALAPTDGEEAARDDGPSPPSSEEEAAMREEIDTLLSRIPRAEAIDPVILGLGVFLAGKGYEKTAEVIAAHETDLRAFLASLSDAEVLEVAREAVRLRPAKDLKMILGSLKAMLHAPREENGGGAS